MEAFWPIGVIPLLEKEYNELIEKSEKLEAVKDWFKENIPERIHKKDWYSGRVITVKSGKLLELEKILKGEA